MHIQLLFVQFSLLCYEFCILSKTECKSIYYHFRRDHESSSFRKLARNKWICWEIFDFFLKKARLERVLRKKWEWENVKDLPVINVLLRKIIEVEIVFDRTNYLNDKEQYFSNLQSWKLSFEKQYLEKYLFLTRTPIRRKRIVRHQKIWLIR